MRSPVACFRIALLASILCFVAASPARAGFVVTGSSGTVALGGTADISFYIKDIPTITIGGPAYDQLNNFQFQLQIIADTTGQLQFVSTDQQAVDFLTDPKSNYVFLNNSLAAQPPVSFWNNVSTTGYTADTVTGGDTVTGSNATFPNPSTFDGSYLLLTARVFADRS